MAVRQESQAISPRSRINYFVVGQLADLMITYTALSHLEGFREVGPAGSSMITEDSNRLIIAKIAVTAFLAGLYAITRDKNPRAEFIGRKSLELSTAIVYLILASNVLQVAPEVLRQLGR
ncbi:hypothetical protein H3C70_01635 [Patescibacteria group bacterium]|nr:hypothetical protein [Patescibacteria group bacterium]